MATSVLYRIKDNNVIIDQDRAYVLRVKDLLEEERPRERLEKYGPSVLSSAELLAIVLNSGTKKEEIMNMTSRIMKEYGEKTLCYQTDPKEVEREFGVPFVKACQIVACFELGRRFFKQPKNSRPIVRTSKQVFSYLKDMRNLQKEHFRGIYLDGRFRVIRDETISIGSYSASIVHPREIFKPAIESGASAVIIAHNHPSGSPKATATDIEVTKQCIQAGQVLGIDLIDHIIIAGNKFSSVPADYEV